MPTSLPHPKLLTAAAAAAAGRRRRRAGGGGWGGTGAEEKETLKINVVGKLSKFGKSRNDEYIKKHESAHYSVMEIQSMYGDVTKTMFTFLGNVVLDMDHVLFECSGLRR